jgi:hypothetical protein
MYRDQKSIHSKKKGRLPLAAILAVLVLTLVGCGGLASASPMSSLQLLTYSIYNQGALSQQDLENTTVLVMLNGDPVIVTNEGGQIMLNGEVNITGTGIDACNGVIYVIDESLVANSGTGAPSDAVPEAAEPTPEVT